jgi:hypothetical protein
VSPSITTKSVGLRNESLSIDPDCLRRRALDRGLSKVSTDEPDTSEGVRLKVGGVNMLRRCDVGGDGATAADVLLSGTMDLCTAVDSLVGYDTLSGIRSDGKAVRLALLVRRDVCASVLPCLLLSGLCFVGMRLPFRTPCEGSAGTSLR